MSTPAAPNTTTSSGVWLPYRRARPSFRCERTVLHQKSAPTLHAPHLSRERNRFSAVVFFFYFIFFFLQCTFASRAQPSKPPTRSNGRRTAVANFLFVRTPGSSPRLRRSGRSRSDPTTTTTTNAATASACLLRSQHDSHVAALVYFKAHTGAFSPKSALSVRIFSYRPTTTTSSSSYRLTALNIFFSEIIIIFLFIVSRISPSSSVPSFKITRLFIFNSYAFARRRRERRGENER